MYKVHETEVVGPDYIYPEEMLELAERWNATPTSKLLDITGRGYHENGTAFLTAMPEEKSPFIHEIRHSAEALVEHSPFGNGDTPWRRLNTAWLANVTGQTVVTVLAPGSKGSSFRFTGKERRDIAQDGDLTPYNRRVVEALGDFFPRLGKVASLGWSQGAPMAVNLGNYAQSSLDVKAVGAGDTPNVVDDSRLGLLKRLTAADYDDIKGELEQAGIVAFSEALGFSGPDKRSDTSRTLEYIRSILSRPLANLALSGALGRQRHAYDLFDLVMKGTNVVKAHGSDSAIETPQTFRHTLSHMKAMRHMTYGEERANAGELHSVRYEGTNHAGGDNKMKYGDFALRVTGLAA